MSGTSLGDTWTNEEKKQDWYTGGIAYWEKTSETNDGVLGGYGIVHDVRSPIACPLIPLLQSFCVFIGGYRGFEEVYQPTPTKAGSGSNPPSSRRGCGHRPHH
jgi:hypothetical protein